MDDFELRERVVVLETMINHTLPRLEAEIKELTSDMKLLMELANRSKGALFVPTVGITAVISALLTWTLDKWK